MKKLNKKGFTLVEMLVVIAIIAILVAVIVPTVTSATTKASAATNAANLRSYLAEVQIFTLDHPGYVKTDGTLDTSVVKSGETAPIKPKSKAVGSSVAANIEASLAWKADGSLNAKFDSYDIDAFARVAASGKVEDLTASSTSTPG